MSSPWTCLPFVNTWVHPEPAYPSWTHEFTLDLLTLREHMSSPWTCLPFVNTWVHSGTAYPSSTHEFTLELLTLRQYMSSPWNCLPLVNTWVHPGTAYPSWTHEFGLFGGFHFAPQFIFLCCVVGFICLRSVCYVVPNITHIFWSSIFDCPFDFSDAYCLMFLVVRRIKISNKHLISIK